MNFRFMAIAFLIALMILVVGCRDSVPSIETGAESTSAFYETEIDPLYENLPTGSYDGYVSNIIQYEAHGAQFSADMDIEEDDGTLLNSALWKRTQLVEGRLNVDVRLTLVQSTDDVSLKISEDISAGDCNFEFFSNHSAHLATQTQNGQALPYNELPEVDLEKPWWNTSVIHQTTAGDGNIYMGFGYINISCYDSQCGVWFNKDMADEYNLGNIYQMVADNEWTMDRFIQICRAVADNGEKLYGVGAYPYGRCTRIDLWLWRIFFEKDDVTGQFTYVGVTDKMYDVYSKMGAMLLDKTVSNLDLATYRDSFRNGETFAMCSNVSGMQEYRNSTLNYGLAPFPKYDENQEQYLSYTTNQIQGVSVAVTTLDKTRSAVILENLASESYRQMKDVYYEQLINIRLLRDDESKKIMVDIFNSPLVLPIEAVYDFHMAGNIFGFDGGGASLTSKADSCRDAVNTALAAFYSRG